MSGVAEFGSSPERPIRRFLVRYGRTGHVAWFGTVHDLSLTRGTAVVVLTATGEWSGEVLRESIGNDRSAPQLSAPQLSAPQLSAPQLSAPPPSGEVLRRVTPADHEAMARAQAKARPLLEFARREVTEALSQPTVTVLDADVSLCGQSGIVLFAGRGGAALGPAAVRIADQLGLARVQWTRAGSPVQEAEAGSPQASAIGTRTAALAGRSPAVSGEREDREQELHERATVTARALSTRDPAEMGALARQQRDYLGMLGAYAQKIREPGMKTASRRWMVRVRPTAGGITVDQLERLTQLAMRHGDGSLRLTMRQGLQLHGVLPGDAAAVIRGIEALAMTTRGSCGNAFRNLTCCALPPRSESAVVARRLATRIAQRWLPRAGWLAWSVDPEPESVEPVVAGGNDPAFPEGYLPHKWKVGVATAEDNCVDVLTNDLGLVVSRGAGGEDCHVDCYVGGSLAYRPGVTGSAAMLAEPLGRIALRDVEEVLEGLTGLHREASTHAVRHWRRLKYLVRRMGTAEIADRLEQRMGRTGLFAPLDRVGVSPWVEHSAWHLQIDGRWARTVGVLGGRLRFGHLTAGEYWLHLCRIGADMRIGPGHSLVVQGIRAADKPRVDELIAGPLSASISEPPIEPGVAGATSPRGPFTCRTLSCVALPTCPLAVAEAERAAPQWQHAAEEAFDSAAQLGLIDAAGRLAVAVSGCSNGCSHPLTSAVGIVAESPGRFRVHVGGDGRRLGRSIGVIAGPSQLAGLLRERSAEFVSQRRGSETFDAWLSRHRS